MQGVTVAQVLWKINVDWKVYFCHTEWSLRLSERVMVKTLRGPTGLVICCLPRCVKLPDGRLRLIRIDKKHINI